MAAKKTKKKTAPSKKTNVKNKKGFFIENIEKFEHSIDFNIPKGLLCAFIFMIISQIVRLIGTLLTQTYYNDVNYAYLWSEIMMPGISSPPASFYVLSMITAFFIGFIYAFFYHMVRVSIHGHAPHHHSVKGLLYGIFLVFVVAIPTMLNQYLILSIPTLLIVSWFAESVIIYLASGTLIAMIMK